MDITPIERKALAEKVGMAEQYIYQCLTGRKAMKPAEAVRVERAAGNAIRRWDLRPDDWHLVWPELIGVEGAPPVPKAEAAESGG